MLVHEKDKRRSAKSKWILFFILLSIAANYPFSWVLMALLMRGAQFVLFIYMMERLWPWSLVEVLLCGIVVDSFNSLFGPSTMEFFIIYVLIKGGVRFFDGGGFIMFIITIFALIMLQLLFAAFAEIDVEYGDLLSIGCMKIGCYLVLSALVWTELLEEMQRPKIRG